MTAGTTRYPRPDLPAGVLPSRVHRWDALATGALTLLVGITLSWRPAYWRDEIATLNAARKTWPELFDMLGTVDVVHGAYYSFMHVWIGLLGDAPFVTRLPSAIACALAAAAVTVLGSTQLSRSAGLFAGIIMAALPIVTAIAFEARGFALCLACITWGAVAFEPARSGRRGARIWYGLLHAFAIALFLQSATVLVAHLVTLLWARSDRRAIHHWLVTCAFVVALVTPLLWIARTQTAQVAWLSRPDLRSLAYSVGTDQWYGGDLRLAAAGLCLLLVAICTPRWMARLYGPKFRAFRALVVAWLVVPMVCVLAVTFLLTPMYSPRYLFYTVPAVALMIGAVLGAIRPRWLGMGALALFVALALRPGIVGRNEFSKTGSDFSAAAAVISDNARPGDAILFVPDRGTEFEPRLIADGYLTDFDPVVDIGRDAGWVDEGLWPHGADLATVAPTLRRYGRVWLVTSPSTYPAEAASAEGIFVNQEWRTSVSWQGPWSKVTLYERPAAG